MKISIVSPERSRRAHRPRERAERLGRGVGNRRARPDAALHGEHPSSPSPPILPRSAVSVGIPANRPRRARRLIEKHGYLRRMEELEDAEEVAKHWSKTIEPLASDRTKK